MKYENGKDIFPDKLLRQIQKYAAGKLVYIPAGEEKRSWGETSGYRKYLYERNQEIKNKFSQSKEIEQLAAEYHLSYETIRRIVYSKKEEQFMEYKCTLSSAKEYAKYGKTEEWIHAYLLSDGHNKDFSEGLKILDRFFIGPVKMPLDLLSRCCGPEENMKYKIDGDWFEHHVTELMEVIKKEKDMPPLIVHYVEGGFELNDGNHRLEAYARLGITEYNVIIWITEQEEYNEFTCRFQFEK